MEGLRVLFEKKGKSIYISHLDLMRTMQRAFTRAGYMLAYSEGYNPHPQISIILPLSVGASSRCEIMDFKLKDACLLDEMPQRLNAAMPEGIRVLEAYEASEKAKYLKFLRVEGHFEYDEGDLNEKARALNSFFSQDELVITKRGKKGPVQSNIRPAISEIGFAAGEEFILMSAVISAQEPALNPSSLVSSLEQLEPELAPSFAKFERLEVYRQDMTVFR